MNNNDYNSYDNDSSGNNGSGEQKEEIRFSEWEMNDAYGGAWDQNTGPGAYGWNNSNYEPPLLIDEIKEKRHFSRVGFGYAAFAVISTLAALMIQIIVMSIDTEFYNSTLFLNLLSPVALYIFALPILLIIVSGAEAKAPEKKRMGVGQWFLFLLIGFGVMYIGAMIGNTVMEYISAFVGYDYSNALDAIVDEENIWITAIFTVIVAPIGEEFVFRKLIIDRTQKYGGVVCVVLSAVMFGLMHGNFYQFFYCVGLGLILGYMYHSTGRLLPCILLHAAINFVGSVIPTWLTPVLEGIEELDVASMEAMTKFVTENLFGIIAAMIFSLFVYVAMALAIILPIALRRKIKLAAPEVALPRGRALAIVIANAGMIVMLVVYALEFVLSLIPA